MKAKVKATGRHIEVTKDNRYIEWVDDIPCYHTEDELEFLDTDTTDYWQAYRMEVAKECMATLMQCTNGQDVDWDCNRFSTWAVQAADALIARLKEQKGE